MIDPRELRIGNYISYYIYDQQNPYPDRIKSIYFGDESKEYRLEMESGKFSLGHLTIQGIKPIPLTEDILMKCGFDEDWESGFIVYKIEVKDSYGHKFDISLVKDDSGISFNYVCWDINCGVKYVHELQNLYYDLTKTELNVQL